MSKNIKKLYCTFEDCKYTTERPYWDLDFEITHLAELRWIIWPAQKLVNLIDSWKINWQNYKFGIGLLLIIAREEIERLLLLANCWDLYIVAFNLLLMVPIMLRLNCTNFVTVQAQSLETLWFIVQKIDAISRWVDANKFSNCAYDFVPSLWR